MATKTPAQAARDHWLTVQLRHLARMDVRSILKALCCPDEMIDEEAARDLVRARLHQTHEGHAARNP